MKTLLLFIGVVLRSRIIQRKGLGAISAIYKLVRHWWNWAPPQPDVEPQDSVVSDHQDQASAVISTRSVKSTAPRIASLGFS